MKKLLSITALFSIVALFAFTNVKPTGTITMLDQDLSLIVINTNDPGIVINGIKIFSPGPQMVLGYLGCDQSECSYSYAPLTSGETYYLKIFTSAGTTGEYITIP